MVKPYIGGFELINRKSRWCLWITDDFSYTEYPTIMNRVEMCKEFRSSSERPQTLKAASTPYAFGEIRQPNTDMLVVPKVSSERREYIPIGFVSPDVIVNGSALIVPDAEWYTFGVMSSQFHNGGCE